MSKETHEFSTKLTVSREGVTGWTEHYDYDWDEFDPNDEIVVEVKFVLPESLFHPMQIQVDIPPEYAERRAAAAAVEEVEVPVDIMERIADDRHFSDGILVSGDRGLMASFKRIVDKATDALRTPKEKEKIEKKKTAEERHKEIERLREKLAELEKSDEE